MKNRSKIILASKSPRRKYLLKQAGITFSVIPSHIDESSIKLLSPADHVVALAEAKAEKVAKSNPEAWVIAADTIVWMDDEILGKPRSRDEAKRMLQKLSGSTHQVYTGFCIRNRVRSVRHSDHVKTDVKFKDLTGEEIDWYIETEEPFDKAGAYAIQGLGTFLVEAVFGSYTNVVGLPVCEVVGWLIKNRVIALKRYGVYNGHS